jgi:hypothetical protein
MNETMNYQNRLPFGNEVYQDLKSGVDFIDVDQLGILFEDTIYLEDALRMGYTEEQLKGFVGEGKLFEGAAMSATPKEDGTNILRYYSIYEENARSIPGFV